MSLPYFCPPRVQSRVANRRAWLGGSPVRTRFVLGATMLMSPSLVMSQPIAYRSAATASVSVAASAPDGSIQFATATWAARLPNGEIAIVDQADGKVHIADSTGQIVRSWGRIGEGPGELRAASWIGVCGTDTLYVWDAQATRLSVMHARTGYLRQMHIPESAGALTLACDNRGNVASFANISPRRGDASRTEHRTRDGRRYEIGLVSAALVVRDRAGAVHRELAEVPYGEMLIGQLTPNGGMGGMQRPLGALTSFAVVDGNLVVACSDAGTVTWYRPDGQVQRTVVLPAVSGAPSVAQYAAAIDRAVEMAPARVRPDLVAFAQQVPRPTTQRPFSQMLASSDGLLWFVISTPGDVVTRLRALDHEGRVAATLEVPTTLELFEVGADFVLGRTETADGEQRVVMYRYSRP